MKTAREQVCQPCASQPHAVICSHPPQPARMSDRWNLSGGNSDASCHQAHGKANRKCLMWAEPSVNWQVDQCIGQVKNGLVSECSERTVGAKAINQETLYKEEIANRREPVV